MNKYNKRINRIVLKTHSYVSNNDYVILRNYLKAKLDEAGVSIEDFTVEREQIKKLVESENKKKSGKFREKFEEIIKGNEQINRLYLYDKTLENCKAFPNGVWLQTEFAKGLLGLIKSAKGYFKAEKRRARN